MVHFLRSIKLNSGKLNQAKKKKHKMYNIRNEKWDTNKNFKFQLNGQFSGNMHI